MGARPIFDGKAGRVTGLIVRRHNCNVEEQLVADLVVDATGRGSQSPKWLEEWGFGQPAVVTVKVNVGGPTSYATRRRARLDDSGRLRSERPTNSSASLGRIHHPTSFHSLHLWKPAGAWFRPIGIEAMPQKLHNLASHSSLSTFALLKSLHSPSLGKVKPRAVMERLGMRFAC